MSGTALTSVGAYRRVVVVLCDLRFGGFKARCGNPHMKGGSDCQWERKRDFKILQMFHCVVCQ